MQVFKWLCFAAFWIFVVAQDIYDDNPNPDTQNYQFRYYVRDESTGDIKSQEETKQGGTVNGHYSVGEPTGDLRVVTYTADEGGFRADVKYEEGGSPASEDKARQTNSKSGVEFHWLPSNPDDIQEGKIGTEEDGNEETNGGSSEGNLSGTESTTTNMSEQPSEATTESNSSTESSSEPSTTEGSDIEIEKVSKESDSSSETFSTESSSETSNTISETPLTSSESTIATTENSMETSTTSIEGKDTLPTDEESNSSTEDEQSAEAAESAPLSEEVLPPLQPSQMYLPVISYQNLPFLNLPMLENNQGYSEKPPTIIYASQNFYNPWQWFGNSRRIARDVQQHINRHIQTTAKGFQYPVIPRKYK